MIIAKEVLNIINQSITDYPPETGGILGTGNGEVIDKVVMDTPDPETLCGCVYSPNVDFLNNRIQQWQRRGILFMGIFHTHFHSVRTLSLADKKYIETIMQVMPSSIYCLYFPIYVLPERMFVGYRAIRENGRVKIENEEIVIQA